MGRIQNELRQFTLKNPNLKWAIDLNVISQGRYTNGQWVYENALITDIQRE